MKWLIGLLRWPFKDRRSDWEIRREKKFIDAVNKLENFSVTERGGLSSDPEKMRDQIEQSRETLKHLVDPAHRSRSEITSPLNPVQQSDESPHTCFTQINTWRRVPPNAAIRYVCLQGMNEDKFAIATTDYYSNEEEFSHLSLFEHRVAQRLKTVECGEPLFWFDSLKEAMDAHDASI